MSDYAPEVTLFEAISLDGEKLTLHVEGNRLWIASDDAPLAGFEWSLGELPWGIAEFRRLSSPPHRSAFLKFQREQRLHEESEHSVAASRLL